MQGYAPDGNYVGVLSGKKISVSGGCFLAEIAGNSGEIWIPDSSKAVEEIEAVEDVESAEEIEVVEETEATEEIEAVEEVEATEEIEVVEEVATTEDVVEESEVVVTVEKTVLEEVLEAAKAEEAQKAEEKEDVVEEELDLNKPYEEMTIKELQASILAKMAKNGPVTDEMRRTVDVNEHHGSLMNWVRSFR